VATQSEAARLLGLWFESRRGMDFFFLYFVSVMCWNIEVSASGLSLVQRSPIESGVYECDREGKGMTSNKVEAPQKNKELYIFPHDSIYVLKRDQSWNKFQFLKDEINVDLLG
jgi:hypothetical protein